MLSNWSRDLQVVDELSLFLSTTSDLFILLRELPQFTTKPLHPCLRALLFYCYRCCYPTKKEKLELLSRSEHVDLTLFRQKAFLPVTITMASVSNLITMIMILVMNGMMTFSRWTLFYKHCSPLRVAAIANCPSSTNLGWIYLLL